MCSVGNMYYTPNYDLKVPHENYDTTKANNGCHC